MNTFKRGFLIGVSALTLSSLTVGSSAWADQNAVANQQLAASIIDFLSSAMYPDSSDLAIGEEQLLTKPEKAEKEANESNNSLVLSSLASGVAIPGAAVVTQQGVQSSNGSNNVGREFSNQKMNNFLCGNGTQKCLYTPSHQYALIQTLTGNPYASNNGGLTAADTLLSKEEANANQDLYDYSNNGTDSSKFTKSLNKSAYFDYNWVFGHHEPENLEPAKYYGLLATRAYDVDLLNKEPTYVEMVGKAVKSNDLYNLRANPVYQNHVLRARQLTAINSALMGNILWLAKQQTISVKKDASPTGKAMSQAEADDYIGNHRLNDNGVWINKIKNESSTELLREQTLLMAEANHQRQVNNVTMQRLLATMTILAAENKELFQLTDSQQEKKAIADRTTR